MDICKTGAEHIRSLQDGRAVYIDGELVGRRDQASRVPQLRGLGRRVSTTFRPPPENIELMTFALDGANRRVNRGWQMPRSHAEMVGRRRALTAWAERSFGFMGRSPDHLASALVGQRIGLDVFAAARRGARQGVCGIFRLCQPQRPVPDLCHHQSAGRPLEGLGRPGATDLVARVVDEDSSGITIRGAKMLGTSSIMANDVFVANLQPLKAGEEDFAFCCALPMGSKGLRVLSRKSYESSAVSVFDNPLSSRFDENDAVIYFDDVKVDWDRVFVHRDVDMCRAQFHDTPGHIYQNYQAQIRLVVKLKFLVGLARRLTETIGTANMPAVREQLGRLAAQAGMVEAMMHGMEAAGEHYGEWWVPNRHQVYSAQVITQDLYPKMINVIRELAGGAFIMLPSSFKDWTNPDARADHPQDAAVGGGRPGRQGEVPQGGVGRGRLGIRLPPHPIRNVLCRRAVRDRRPQLPHLRMGRGGKHGR